jgi:LacI family transcriptional regulator
MATLRDVAAHAGLSPATISRALSGHRYVDGATRDRAIEAAAALGYRPNSLARALRAKRTMSVGLIIPDIRNDFFAESATVLQSAFEECGYRLLLCISGNDPERDRSYLRMLAEFRVDGLIYVPSMAGGATGLFSAPKRIPIVELLRHSEPGTVDAIVSDDREGSFALTAQLIAAGHRRIAMIAGEASLSTTRYRIEGYREALRQAGLSAQIVRSSYTPEAGYRSAREVFAREPRPTAIYSSGSPLTVGILRAFKDLNIRIPADVSLVAYEDPEWYAAQNPPITGYQLPLREMAMRAVDRVMARIAADDDADWTPELLRFPGRVVVRGSTAAPADSP